MKIKNNKGLTGVDVTIAVVILAIFVTLITNMFYNVSQIANTVNRKSQATYIAVQVIEAMKQLEYNSLPKGYVGESDLVDMTVEEAEIENTTITLEGLNTILGDEKKIKLNNGYSVDIKVENYIKIKDDLELKDILKQLTVTVKYKNKNKEQKVELSTVVVNEENVI